MRTSELTSLALDWAVATCEHKVWATWRFKEDYDDGNHQYGEDWSLAGPIIEREKITLEWTGEDWMAYIRHDEECFGPTPLIASMRCYVASKLGDVVTLPPELEQTV